MKERKKSSRQLLYKIVNLCLDEDVQFTLTKKQLVRHLSRHYHVTEKPRKKNELQDNPK
jgi:hypothetical protein